METPDELRTALKSAFEETSKVKKPVLINTMISPYADRKPQVQYILTLDFNLIFCIREQR